MTRPTCWEVEPRNAVFRSLVIQRVLREGIRAACAERTKNRAGVVGGFAPRIVRLHGQLFEQIGSPELGLQPVIVGIGCIGPLANLAFVTVLASRGRGYNRIGGWARRQTCRQQVGVEYAIADPLRQS